MKKSRFADEQIIGMLRQIRPKFALLTCVVKRYLG